MATHTIETHTLETQVPVERRRQDGLGLLSPTMNPEQRRRRERFNRAGGLTLTTAGAFLVGGSLGLLYAQPDMVACMGVLLGLSLLAQGILLVGRRDRRGTRRRRTRTDRRT
jgi:hypothetical protein